MAQLLAATSPNRAETLDALIVVLKETIDAADPGQRASLAKQLREALADRDALPVARGDSVDDLAAKRANRRAGAQPVDGPADSGKQRRSGGSGVS